MPWRDDYFVPLNYEDPKGDWLRIRINTERGIVRDFVVQYEMPISDVSHEHVAVVRYDGSYQRPHRDLLDADGVSIRKTWLPDHHSLGEALNYAIEEIEQNWRRYRQDFLLRSRR